MRDCKHSSYHHRMNSEHWDTISTYIHTYIPTSSFVHNRCELSFLASLVDSDSKIWTLSSSGRPLTVHTHMKNTLHIHTYIHTYMYTYTMFDTLQVYKLPLISLLEIFAIESPFLSTGSEKLLLKCFGFFFKTLARGICTEALLSNLSTTLLYADLENMYVYICVYKKLIQRY